MAKLQNTFSWSHSSGNDFSLCRRKRYWSKYGAWGGWERDAAPQCRTAYRLNKMDNRHTLRGVAVEETLMWMLRQHQAGTPVTPEAAFDQVARRWLRARWDESTGKVWLRAPKACCLHEHYYPQFHTGTDRDHMFEVADHVKSCLAHFHSTILPRIAHVTAQMEVPVATIGKGDVEHFFLDGIKIYAIPDYVYREDGVWHILDWKSGSPKPEHAEQILLYALWAREKHGVPPDQVRLALEYLGSGERIDLAVTEADLERIQEQILDSVQDMAQYLEDADLKANRPLPREEWDLCFEPDLCSRCPFYELCAPELEGLFDGFSPEDEASAD